MTKIRIIAAVTPYHSSFFPFSSCPKFTLFSGRVFVWKEEPPPLPLFSARPAAASLCVYKKTCNNPLPLPTPPLRGMWVAGMCVRVCICVCRVVGTTRLTCVSICLVLSASSRPELYLSVRAEKEESEVGKG